MRIAMVSEHASPLAAAGGPDSGGQNLHVHALARHLAARGHDVEVFTRRDAPDLPDTVALHPRLRVRHMAAGPPRPVPKDELVAHLPAMVDCLARAWAPAPPDVVHAHFWMSGIVAAAATEGLGVALVQTFHALGTVKRRHQGAADTSPRERVPAERLLARMADRVVATCEDERVELLAMGTPPTRVTVVPCGVDAHDFRPAGPVREPGRRPRLVTVGRLVRRKGVDEVIEALSDVPGAELLIAGGPPPGHDHAEDPDLRRLRALAAAVGVTDRVRLLGALAHTEVPALLRSADVVVCAPWYEPFGMVALEAMACGRPVVATTVGGQQETVVHGQTGLHVRPRRPDELARALRRLTADPDTAARFGRAGRTRVLARYVWPRVAAATEAVYRQVRDARAAAVRPSPIGGVA